MAGTERLIGRSSEIAERGQGLRFRVDTPDGSGLPAFAVRYRGTLYAYVNRCAHIGIELDWSQGQFFDVSGLYLICSTHGAAYYPESGRCALGPCKGGGLQPLPVVERDGQVYLIENGEMAND